MPVRLLLILTLLLQPLALRGAAGSAAATECRDASCCRMVETTTCCGETFTEQVCGRSGGACRCGVHRDGDDPAPAVPLAPDRNEHGSQLFTAAAGVTLAAPAATRTPVLSARPVVHRTHNETQALLCIWRT